MDEFWGRVRLAQHNELVEVEKAHAEERKRAEALRKVNYPGTISGRELVPQPEDAEQNLTKQLDEIDSATRKAEKEAKDNAERPLAGAFPPPPITE